MCDDGNDATASNAIELVGRSHGEISARKLDEHRFSAAQRQCGRAEIASGAVEHDLPSEPELGLRWRCRHEIREDRLVPLVWREVRARRLEVRCTDEHLQ